MRVGFHFSDSEPTEGRSVRSRLRSLILRELPNPLRWIVAEILHFLDWIDRTVGAFMKGMRESPAWYFMTMIGSLAVFLTLVMFLSVIDQTSGRNARALPVRSTANLSRRDLEVLNEWTVQDRWRVAHFFVRDQPRQLPRDIQLDSRLNAPADPVAQTRFGESFKPSSVARRSTSRKGLDVRLDLSRPKVAQQGTRVVAGTVLDPGFQIAEHSMVGREHDLERQIRSQAPQALVQASWEFGPECNAREYVAVPVRRPKPVRVPLPEPEPELEPEPITVPARQTSPDLSFELAMIRHFSVEGLHPPGARLVESSDRSRFEIEERTSSRDLAADQNWRESRPSSHRPQTDPPPYEGLGKFVLRNDHNLPGDEYDETLRAVADVALRVELDVPSTVPSGTRQQSQLHITNEGQDQISRIEVRDFPVHLRTVVGANPDASTESVTEPGTGSRQTTLHRELPPLLPGDERDLTLDWITEGPAKQTQRAHVIAHTEVSTLTRVTRPPAEQPMPSVPPEQVENSPSLECDIAHLDRVYLGDDVDLEITVRNTGDTTLHRVQVAVDVPAQLSHHYGKTVVIEAGNLPVRGQKQTVIKLAAVQSGEAVNKLRIDAKERVEARGQTSLQVVERRPKELPKEPVTQTKSTSVPAPKPVAKPPVAKPLTKPKPLPAQPIEECCCQRVTLIPELPNRLMSWTD